MGLSSVVPYLQMTEIFDFRFRNADFGFSKKENIQFFRDFPLEAMWFYVFRRLSGKHKVRLPLHPPRLCGEYYFTTEAIYVY